MSSAVGVYRDGDVCVSVGVYRDGDVVGVYRDGDVVCRLL